MNLELALKVSIIIVSHDKRINELKKVIHKLEKQTYKNLEIIIIGNGFTHNNHKYLIEWQNKNISKNIYKNFKENINDLRDHSKIGRKRYQVGINISSGDLIYCQSDDDFLCLDYVEKITKLFKDNPHCLTAIGIPGEYIWEEDKFLKPKSDVWENRKKYISGKDAVIKTLTIKNYMPNPGFSYVFKKELLKEVGNNIWYGYDTSILLSLCKLLNSCNRDRGYPNAT